MNTNMLKNIIMFMSGAGIGALTTYLFLKNKYEKIAQEEIDSVKETFSKRESELDRNEISNIEDNDVKMKARAAKLKPEIAGYVTMLRKMDYTSYSGETKPVPEIEKEDETAFEHQPPYVISPEEFTESEDYTPISLTYYADQILADDCDELVEDVENTVGFESLGTFGEYEEDSVFVRNDRLRCDYEILKDQRNYSDVVRMKRHLSISHLSGRNND